MPQKSGLTVRQHERASIELDAELIVGDGHRAQVRFTPISAALDAHRIPAAAVDISPGGIGLRCAHFVPRMCEGRVRVFDPVPSGKRGDGTPLHEVAFEHAVKVRRVVMVGLEMTYLIGASFVDPVPGLDASVADLLEKLSAAESAAAERGDADA